MKGSATMVNSGPMSPLVPTYLIMLKCPVSVDNSIFCFSEPSSFGRALLCMSGLEAAPDLRDMVMPDKWRRWKLLKVEGESEEKTGREAKGEGRRCTRRLRAFL